MADYQLTDPIMGGTIIRTEDGACIPPSSANADYVDYLQWLEDGGVPDPYVPPPPPPPPAPDANERLDAGIAAAVATVLTARNAVNAIPTGGAIPARFDALLVQMKVTMDAFVAMLQAQQNPP